MNISKGRRNCDPDDDSSLSNINSRLLQTKKRIRILELTDSTADEDDITNFRSHYENDQKTRKVKRNRGEKYYTKTGNIIPAKKFENKDSKCVEVCKNRILEEERISLFNLFWEMGDFEKENTFLCASTHREEHSIHLSNAELARKCLKEDQNLASKNSDNYFAFSFDLQKALPYPKLSVSVAL